jgi:hypothetical protein
MKIFIFSNDSGKIARREFYKPSPSMTGHEYKEIWSQILSQINVTAAHYHNVVFCSTAPYTTTTLFA